MLESEGLKIFSLEKGDKTTREEILKVTVLPPDMGKETADRVYSDIVWNTRCPQASSIPFIMPGSVVTYNRGRTVPKRKMGDH